MDMSGSITIPNWKTEKKFIKSLVKAIGISPTGGHAAVTLFDKRAKLKIKFSDHKNFNSFKTALLSLRRAGGGTRIDLGLEVALDQMFTVSNGMRPTSAKSVVLITDGTNDKKWDSAAWRNKFRERNITLIVIGAGKVNKAELEKLVDNPSDLHIASDMEALKMGEFFRGVGKALCNGK
jgi:uncharacterized protein YegL